MELHTLSVGEIYPPAKIREEGAILSIDAGGLMLWLNYHRPTTREVENWTQSGKPAQFSYVVKDGIFIFLAKAEGEDWVESPYAPQISETYRELCDVPNDDVGYSLQIMMTDKDSGIIRGLRLVGLGNKFSKKLKQQLDEINEVPFNAEEYRYALQKIYSNYSTIELLSFASQKYKI